MPPRPHPRLVSIQCLRGVAALLVLFFHAQNAVATRLPGRSALAGFFALGQLGSIGVDVFFVISGFIMVHVSADQFGRRGAGREFLVRRVIRIVPLYWLVTAFMVALLLFVPQAFGTLRFRLGHAVSSFLFLPTTNSYGEMVPVLGVGWTLTYEMIFYVLFAALLATSLRTSLTVCAVLFTLAAIGARLWPPTTATAATLLGDRFLEFFAGECVGAWLLRSASVRPPIARVLVALVAAVLVAHVFFGELRAVPLLTVALPAAALVLALVSLERSGLFRAPAWLQRTGDESYSLYLSHPVTTAAFMKVCAASGLLTVVPADALIVLAIVNAVFWSSVLHRTVERPVTAALARAWRRFAHEPPLHVP